MRRKGQAAMEFLMTYGWAILVVLAAIGALAYFGILSPDRFLPERCTGPAGLDCLEKASIDSSADTFSFALKNNLGININITGLTDGATDDSSCDSFDNTTVSVAGGAATNLGTNYVTVNNGQSFVVVVDCGEDVPEGRASADFSLEYKSLSTGLNQKGAISIKGKGVA